MPKHVKGDLVAPEPNEREQEQGQQFAPLEAGIKPVAVLENWPIFRIEDGENSRWVAQLCLSI